MEYEKRLVALNDNEDVTGYVIFDKNDDGVIDAKGTIVKEEFRGQGIASELLDAMVAEAEKEETQIIPTCTFFENQFNDNPEKYDHVNAEK